MGNRLAKTDNQTGSESYGYNNANMLLTRNGQSYNNDANGNTLSGGGRTMTWDSQNRMASCIAGTGANQKKSSFAYGTDGLRRRMSVTSSTGSYTTDYILDGNNVVQELTTTPSNVNPILTATYLMGPSGPMYKRPANSSDVRWYVYDGGGNVTGEVDPLGNVTASQKHDVYGASRGVTGTATSKHGWQGDVGHQSDGETGFVYMRARYYAPELGRFQSEDPQGDGKNWFIYCDVDPINKKDADGRVSDFVVFEIQQLFAMARITVPTVEFALLFKAPHLFTQTMVIAMLRNLVGSLMSTIGSRAIMEGIAMYAASWEEGGKHNPVNELKVLKSGVIGSNVAQKAYLIIRLRQFIAILGSEL
jgi:RHS repeat-associated protein